MPCDAPVMMVVFCCSLIVMVHREMEKPGSKK